MFVELPNISQNTPPTLMAEEIRRYIYKSNEQINLAFADVSAEKLWEKTATVLSANATVLSDSNKVTQETNRYKNLRDLIIKSADIILEQSDELKRVLNGSYIAKSDFGTFLLNTRLEILESSKSIYELFTYAAEANEYTVYQKSSFERGLLNEDDVINHGANPIYGMQIGLMQYEFLKDENDNEVLDENGHKILIETDSNKYLRITPDRIGLWKSDNEVASLSEQGLFFPSARITGGSINLNNNFIVESDGTVTIKQGSINLNNQFTVDNNGFARMKGADLYYNAFANSLYFYEEDGSKNNTCGGVGSTISPYADNYGVTLGGDFVSIGDLIFNIQPNSYKSGLSKGLYVKDDINNIYKGRTATITINGTTLKFMDGLLVSNS